MFDHQSLKVFFRGQIVPFEKANISIANTGFLYGLGVFTGMRAHYNTVTDQLFIFRPADHFNRLRFACKTMRHQNFLSTYDSSSFLEIVKQLLTANQIREDVYIRVTNFSDENRISPKLVGYSDSLCAFLYPLGDYVPTTGMRCKVSSWSRIRDNAFPARSKICGAYVNTALTKTEALLDGYDEALVLDDRGHVVEGSAENIFLVYENRIYTPPASDDILEGITRRSVIQIARDLGHEVVERSIDRTELYKADEIFLSGTGAKVSPVIEVDKYPVGTGEPGPVALRIQEIYSKAVRGELENYIHWVESAY